MRLWPDTLTGRALVVMLAGIVLSNGIGIVVFSGERLDLLTSARGYRLAERVAATARLLEETPPEQRRRLVRHMRGPRLRIFWSSEPVTEGGPADWQTRLIRGALVTELGSDQPDRLRLTLAQRPDLRGFPGASKRGQRAQDHPEFAERRASGAGSDIPEGVLLGAYRLSDGSWLNFAAPFAAFRPFWMTRVFFAVVATMVCVLAVSIWAVRRATQPLSMFAGAAERLGVDMNARPLTEEGPREVRRASRAFNEMQRRLQSFVRDRTQMLAAISHDLRTPITRLRLRAELIEDAEQQRKVLSDLDEIQSMIAATLAFARDDFAREEQTTFDLAVLLQDICDEAQDVRAAASYGGPEHVIYTGRPAALKRAFSNLIDNAVNYGGNGKVVLSVVSRSLRVSIEDDGPGIPDDEQERIFEPFYRLERSRNRDTGGVGLGLAVVRSVIRSHGGEVTVANRDTGGLCVTVTLPTPSA